MSNTDVQEIIKKFKNDSAIAKTEEDVRQACSIFIDKVKEIYGLDFKNENNLYSKQGGFADSIFNNVIFEYKTPNKFNSQRGIDEAIYGRKGTTDRGLKHYIVNITLDKLIEGESNDIFKKDLQSKHGVGFDGETFIFYRFGDGVEKINLYEPKKSKKFPKNINKYIFASELIEPSKNFELSTNKLLLILRSINRKKLSAENILQTFAKSDISNLSITYLHEVLIKELKSSNPKIKTLYSEWNRIFGIMFGNSETEFTRFKDDLRGMYNLPNNFEIKNVLFVLQTYFSIVLKLLIHNLFISVTKPTEKINEITDQDELISLFSGELYTSYKINNFFETHFFEWFLFKKNLKIDFVNQIIIELNQFETTASIIKPETVRDVLKHIYPELIPQKLRSRMGEYYTPDWLVDFTIKESNYDADKNTSLLDPTCGSGTFLTHAINKFREKHKDSLTSKEIINRIVKNIVGFDINPIAVISAKTNYILALGNISEIEEAISIPVYMCDSVLVPTVFAKQKKEAATYKIETSLGQFELPIFNSREESDKFFNKTSFAINKDYNFNEFIKMIKKEGELKFSDEQVEINKKFFNTLIKHHKKEKNGFWPVILKNSFAPLFSKSKFDVLVGNPPWITWKKMSDTHKKQTLDIWLSYGIFEKNAYDKKTTHDDFGMAVTYVSIDHYLKKNCIASFVLPQTFIKSSKGGEGFRKFEITRDNQTVSFSVNSVYDMVKINPFRKVATNKTAVYVFQKNKKIKYPMNNYIECTNKNTSEKINYDDTYLEYLNKVQYKKLSAKPINVNPRSPWLTMTKAELKDFQKFYGEAKKTYDARKGIEPAGAKGIYILNVIRNERGKLVIENILKKSKPAQINKYKMKTIKGVVDKEFVYPVISGRHIRKWGFKHEYYILSPHSNDLSKPTEIQYGVPEEKLKVNYKDTYKWLYKFKDTLLETRIINHLAFETGKENKEKAMKLFKKGRYSPPYPFYILQNVGPYAYSKFKVVWKEQSKEMMCAVISTLSNEFFHKKNILVDSKVYYAPMDNLEEAHYLCSILNSKAIGEIIKSYTIDIGKGTDILDNFKIPKFDKSRNCHKLISEYSIEAHKAFKDKNISEISKYQNLIDKMVHKIF